MNKIAKKYLRSDVLSHPKIHQFMRKQELVKEFMLALAPAYRNDEAFLVQEVRLFAEDLAKEFLNRYDLGFTAVENEIKKELESK